jgi:hypothetical protein
MQDHCDTQHLRRQDAAMQHARVPFLPRRLAVRASSLNWRLDSAATSVASGNAPLAPLPKR